MNADQKKRAATRARLHAGAKEQELVAHNKADRARQGDMPMHPSLFMKELAAWLPKDSIIFDEALITTSDLVHYLPPTMLGHYFQTRGGSLGVDLPGALGLKLAHPDKAGIPYPLWNPVQQKKNEVYSDGIQ